MVHKSQIPTSKFQANLNPQFQRRARGSIGVLNFGISLGFGAWNLEVVDLVWARGVALANNHTSAHVRNVGDEI
jgi:hypothetical protein